MVLENLKVTKACVKYGEILSQIEKLIGLSQVSDNSASTKMVCAHRYSMLNDVLKNYLNHSAAE